MSNWFGDIISGGVDKVVDSVAGGLDKLFTSDEERLKAKNMLEQIRNNLKSQLIQAFTVALQAKRDVIVAEIQGESWLQRNWRPMTMLIFAYIIANEYIVAPYVSVIFDVDLKPKSIDHEMWNLLKLGIGGYISALGIKKVVDSSKWAK